MAQLPEQAVAPGEQGTLGADGCRVIGPAGHLAQVQPCLWECSHQLGLCDLDKWGSKAHGSMPVGPAAALLRAHLLRAAMAQLARQALPPRVQVAI